MNITLQGVNSETEKINIMLVDDDDAVRDAVCEILRRRGWNVVEFNNAETALSALKRDKVDVVLSDISMPGMGGMEFLRLAKEVAPGVPFVMITGYPSLDLAVEAMKVGAADFLAKPFKTEELEITIRKAVIECDVAKGKVTGLAPRFKGTGHEVARHRLEDKIKELSIMHTISEMLDEVNEKEEIFRKTMSLAQIIADADRAFVMVVEENNKDLVVHAASGYDEQALIGKRFALTEEPFRRVVESRSPVYFQTGNKDNRLAVLAGGDWSKGGPLFLAPMMINKEVVVVLGLLAQTAVKELTSDAQALLMNLTAKASLKLENIALSENIFSSIIGAINSLINALDARDTYTKDHSNRVTRYATKIAKAMGCSQEVLDSISFAGPLHDIGKIAIRDEVLLKKGYFTDEEREIIKSHVVRGEEILRPLNLLSIEKAVVLYHHERWDGRGYPHNLAGEDIPLVARIFSVADTFDAMTSTRPYRNALSMEVAKDEILRCRGTQFDPNVVDAFTQSGILNASA